VRRLIVLVALLGAPLPVLAQAMAGADVLAEVLAAEDARRYDEPLLRRAMAERDTAVHRAVLRSIGRLRDPRGLNLLREALSEGDTLTEPTTVFAIGLLGDSLGGSLLIRHYRERPTITVATGRELVTAVARIGGPEAAGFLRDLLQGGGGRPVHDDWVERAALESWRLGRLAPVDALLPLLGDERDPVRGAAAYSLSRLRARAAAPRFLQVLQDKSSQVRQAAARTLTRTYADSAGLPPDQVASLLARAATDTDPLVRVAALRSLATFRDPGSVSRVLALLDDPVLNVQVQAAQTLGELGGSAAVEELARIAGAGKGTWARRAEALVGLARADTAAFLRVQGPWAASRDWRERIVAARAWARARPSQLAVFLEDADARVVAATLEAWGEVAPADEQEYARHSAQHLTDQDMAVRAVAAGGLARGGNPADIPRLVAAYRQAMRDSFPDAAVAALNGIVTILAANPAQAEGLERDLVGTMPEPRNYVIRRWAEDNWPALARSWRPAWPVTTGRTLDEYRALVRTLVLGTPEERYPEVRVTMEQLGSFTIKLYGPDAPLTVANFLTLVDRRFFDGIRFHRVVPGFVVQTGDPRGDGWGGAATPIRDEINQRRYDPFRVGMALSGPDTGGSQWFVTLGSQPHLDGGYTVFGEVTDGVPALLRLTQGDQIRSIRRS
jgi:cyclophilin family peptidyl-prolyl cis-trans isomerase/HEAT repeat protein